MSKLQRLWKVATDPRWWSFYLQRRVRAPGHRVAIADRISATKPSYVPVDLHRAGVGLRDLKGAGLHDLGRLLTMEQCRELVSYFENKPVYDPYRSEASKFLPLSDARLGATHIAHHDAKDVLAAPYLLHLANDSRIIDVVGRFLGCKPTIGYMAAWWSYATGLGPQQAENFHRDVDDWRFVKLFVYLTDVTSESGPHKYVLYSASQNKLTTIRRFSDLEVAEKFELENIRTMTAESGQAFLEDTFGIHKGQAVQSGQRLLFQVVYTLTSLPYAPQGPVAAMPIEEAFDPWINRIYLK